MPRLVCTNCGYEWEYKGKNPYYATCPRCLRKVNIEKGKAKAAEIERLQRVQATG